MNILSVCLILVLPMNVLSREQNNWDYSFLEKYGEIILNHITTKEDPLDQIAEYRKFFDNMNQIEISSTSTVMLSLHVSELMEVFPENEDLKYIIDNLPQEITKIPWDRSVNIFNDETKNYLCADEETFQYKVYSSPRRGENCLWNLIILENGRYFRIENNAHYRYMYGSPEPSDADQQLRTISTADDTVNITYLSDRWQFKPHRNDQTNIFEYQIKNYLWKEYIIAQKSLDVSVREFSHSYTYLYLWRFTTEKRQLSIERENVLSKLYTSYNGDSVTAELLLRHASISTTRLIEYVNLFELMKMHDGFYSVAGLMLDHNVEQLLEQYPNDYDLIQIEKHFRNLWPSFPWNRRIVIENHGDSKFLCRFKDNYKVFLGGMSIETCSWEFVTDPSESNFRIKAFSDDFYLIAEPKTFFDFGLRRLTISNKAVEKSIDKWQLYYKGSQKDAVEIKNVAWNEIFYSSFSTRPAADSNPNCQKLICEWLIKEV